MQELHARDPWLRQRRTACLGATVSGWQGRCAQTQTCGLRTAMPLRAPLGSIHVGAQPLHQASGSQRPAAYHTAQSGSGEGTEQLIFTGLPAPAAIGSLQRQ